MIRKGRGNGPETEAVHRFGALLSSHLRRGTRPAGLPDTEGVRWTVKEFADAVRVTARSVRAWRAGHNLPNDLTAIERELFGKNPTYRDFRNELRRLHRLAGENRIETVSEMVLCLTGQDTNDLIATEFQRSAALFTVGAGRTVLVPKPEMALIGFRNVVHRLWEIDSADNQERALVWILDLGRQEFDDPDSRLRFTDVHDLITRFKALEQFKDSRKVDRWNWLQSRTVIVLHDPCSDRPDVPRPPAFDPQHVLFSAIPPRWAGSPEFVQLYGKERLQETNYSIFLNCADEGSLTEIELSDRISNSHYGLRYFGHALLKSDEDGGRQPRGLQLNAPGHSYVEALGTVFVAATHILGLRSVPGELLIDGMKINPAHAVEKLRHHGFLLLRLEEFMRF